MSDTPTWQRASPLSVLHFFGRAFKSLIGNTLPMIGSVGAMVVFLRTENVAWAVLAVLAVLVLLVATALLRYWYFRFALDDDGLRIRQGVLKKTHLDIQFDRVQGIDVERSLIYRMLSLATVTFDTAGSVSREAELPAVGEAFVAELRGRIERHVRPDAAPVAGAQRQSGPLISLDAADMVRIGLTDRSVLVGLASLPVLYQAFDEAIESVAEQAFAAASAEVSELGLGLGLLALLALLLVGFAVLVGLMIVSAFLRFNGYELLEDGTAFRSRAGLLTRREVAIDRAKIQELHLVQGLVMRMLGYCRLRILPATSGGEPSGDNMALTVPLLHLGAVPDLKRRAFDAEAPRLGLDPAGTFVGVSPLCIRTPLLAVGVLPALVAATALLPILGPVALFALAWPLPVAIVAWQRWRRRGYCYDDDGMASRTGLIGFSVHAFLFRKAQGASLSRSPLQRRHGLATLAVHLASGTILVRYIDYATACRLRDYLLFKVESSNRPWH